MSLFAKGLFLLISSLLLYGCEGEIHVPHEVSFYYWKSSFSLSKTETRTLQDLKVKRLYVKFFDVKADASVHGNSPIAPIRADSGSFAASYELVPCVFLENRVFSHLDSNGILMLAKNVSNKVNSRLGQFGHKTVEEIHVDCDWSSTTRQAYFDFLKALKTYAKTEVTSTIRLHQIKYAKQTGIPPVSKGILMCYNMGVIQDVKENNSIFNVSLLKNYTQHIDQYPLLLDIALPIYEWGVVFRNNRYAYILNNPAPDYAQLEQVEKNRYKCEASTRVGNRTLLKGDIVRQERISNEELAKSIQWFDDKLKKYTIVFYHLDEQNIVSHADIFHSITTF